MPTWFADDTVVNTGAHNETVQTKLNDERNENKRLILMNSWGQYVGTCLPPLQENIPLPPKHVFIFTFLFLCCITFGAKVLQGTVEAIYCLSTLDFLVGPLRGQMGNRTCAGKIGIRSSDLLAIVRASKPYPTTAQRDVRAQVPDE